MSRVNDWVPLGISWKEGLQFNILVLFSSVQSLSHVGLFVTPWTATHQASLSITNSRSLLKLMSITSVISSNHIIFCCPLLLLPSIFPSIDVFSNESVLHNRYPKLLKLLELQFHHPSFQWVFRVNFLEDELVWSPCSPRDSQESSPSSKVSVLRHSAF